MSLEYNKNNIRLAKNLRKNATPQENHLWYDFLSKHEIRFQRQKAIDNFIVDFYCHKAKLIIEIDGSQHYTEEGRDKDEFRTEILKGYDLKVIRLTNYQINTNFQGVCQYINIVVKAAIEENIEQANSKGKIASIQPQAPSTAMRSPFLSEEGREQVVAKAIHEALGK